MATGHSFGAILTLNGTSDVISQPLVLFGGHINIAPYCSVPFLAVLDPRVGHTMDVLSPFIPALCHSDLLAAPPLDPSLYLALRARPWLRMSQSYDLSDVDTTLMLFAAATVCSRTQSWQ